MKVFLTLFILGVSGVRMSLAKEEEPYKYYKPDQYHYWHSAATNVQQRLENRLDQTRRQSQSIRRQLLDILTGPASNSAMMFAGAGVSQVLTLTSVGLIP